MWIRNLVAFTAWSLLLINLNLEGYTISTPQRLRKWKRSHPLVEDKENEKALNPDQQCRKMKMEIPQLFQHMSLVHNILKRIS
jgi:hypothetical protein